jgi:hypothetical protein
MTGGFDSGGRISGGDTASAIHIGAAGPSGTAKPESYSWYRAEIINRSITDEVKRDAIRAYLLWLADKLDQDSLDHQLITVKYELMAGTDASLTADFKMPRPSRQIRRTSKKRPDYTAIPRSLSHQWFPFPTTSSSSPTWTPSRRSSPASPG